MGHITIRDGDHVAVFSTSVMDVLFSGTLRDFGEWKCEQQMIGHRDPSHWYSPREFVDMYVDNDWFLVPDEYERQTGTVATLDLR